MVNTKIRKILHITKSYIRSSKGKVLDTLYEEGYYPIRLIYEKFDREKNQARGGNGYHAPCKKRSFLEFHETSVPPAHFPTYGHEKSHNPFTGYSSSHTIIKIGINN
jgi:hypothetical protein